MLSSSSLFTTLKPEVAVVNVTAPTFPDAAAKVSVKPALAVVVVEPAVGELWRIESGVTVNEKLHVPGMSFSESETFPPIV